MDALMIVDYQQALFMGEPATRLAHETAGTLAACAGKARALGWPVIYIRHEEDGTLWDPASPGWQYPDVLAPQPGDDIVAKRSCDAFRDTDLDALLRRRDIDGLWIGGYATEFCVDTTIRSAASRNLRVTVIADGHTTRDRPHLDADSIVRHHNATWARFVNPGHPIRVLPSDQLG